MGESDFNEIEISYTSREIKVGLSHHFTDFKFV